LTADPTLGIWTLHYVLRRASSDAERALVGVAGFGGAPGADGVVDIGYAIAGEHQRQGYATEAVNALLALAFADPRVLRVGATTYATLRPSIGVLQKTGFTEISHDVSTGFMRFERERMARTRTATDDWSSPDGS
jgi:RimJ/RimL family protein N-acetyltransferase